MNKKGFTLIELLAVIVILAIIAVIAVPIVLNIIDESKENATLRSAEFYVKAAELSIANSTLKDKNIQDGTYDIKYGDICLNNDCSDKLEVEVNGEVPESGTITITNGNITGLNIMLDGKEIYKNSKNELVYTKFLEDVCKPAEEQEQLYATEPKTAGYKYECKVDPNKDPYTFYVLNTRNKAGEIITESSTDKDAVSINLIMAQNINSDGTPTTKAIQEENKDSNGGIYNIVEWTNEIDYGTLYPYDDDICWKKSGCVLNDKGPITAMNFLSEATKNWTNTNEIIVDTFTDETGATYNMKSYNTYARLPYYSEVGGANGTNEYLYENLDGENWYGIDGKQPTNTINGINGYLTLSSQQDSSYIFAWGVASTGIMDDFCVIDYAYYGVRPVINLKI